MYMHAALVLRFLTVCSIYTGMAEEKVNAELFLDLPDDEDFLKGLGLSLGFKKLVVKKANEVSGNNVMIFFFFFLSMTVSLDVLMIQLKRQKAVVMDDDTDGRSNVGSRSGMEKIEQQAHIGQGRGQITEEPVTGQPTSRFTGGIIIPNKLCDKRLHCFN